MNIYFTFFSGSQLALHLGTLLMVLMSNRGQDIPLRVEKNNNKTTYKTIIFQTVTYFLGLKGNLKDQYTTQT